jgi:hypothetical protein
MLYFGAISASGPNYYAAVSRRRHTFCRAICITFPAFPGFHARLATRVFPLSRRTWFAGRFAARKLAPVRCFVAAAPIFNELSTPRISVWLAKLAHAMRNDLCFLAVLYFPRRRPIISLSIINIDVTAELKPR